MYVFETIVLLSNSLLWTRQLVKYKTVFLDNFKWQIVAEYWNYNTPDPVTMEIKF